MELVAFVARLPHPVLAKAAIGLTAGVLVLLVLLVISRVRLARAMSRLATAAARVVESRRERYSLLWFPTLNVSDAERLVVSAAAGLPHCPRCVRPLKFQSGAPDEWVCPGCGERRPSSTGDLLVTDSVIAETIQEFITRHPGYRAGPSLPKPAGSHAPS